jgi:hypothetical protein
MTLGGGPEDVSQRKKILAEKLSKVRTFRSILKTVKLSKLAAIHFV